jgi:hypothetical protein
MALPASGPISSSMIAQEFSSSQAPSGPNISLKGLASELGTPVTSDIFMGASFYGQSAFSGTAFSYNSEGESTGAAACALEEVEDTAYHDNGSGGGGTAPAVNDRVYTDSGGSTLLATGVYKIQDNSYMVIVEDGNGLPGLVQSVSSCGRSDRRLKRNIVFRTYSKSGIPIYEFEYINKLDGEGRYIGTMAQDLIKLGKSEAVITDKEGFYLVDYNKVDVNFFKI